MNTEIVAREIWRCPSEISPSGTLSFRVVLLKNLWGRFIAKAGEGTDEWLSANGDPLPYELAKFFFPFLKWKDYGC